MSPAVKLAALAVISLFASVAQAQTEAPPDYSVLVPVPPALLQNARPGVGDELIRSVSEVTSAFARYSGRIMPGTIAQASVEGALTPFPVFGFTPRANKVQWKLLPLNSHQVKACFLAKISNAEDWASFIQSSSFLKLNSSGTDCSSSLRWKAPTAYPMVAAGTRVLDMSQVVTPTFSTGSIQVQTWMDGEGAVNLVPRTTEPAANMTAGSATAFNITIQNTGVYPLTMVSGKVGSGLTSTYLGNSCDFLPALGSCHAQVLAAGLPTGAQKQVNVLSALYTSSMGDVSTMSITVVSRIAR